MSENTNEQMAEKLKAAGEKAEKQRAERQARVVKGAHLLPTLKEQIQSAGLSVEEKTSFLKVTKEGSKGRAIYVAKKGGRVDLSGFTVEAAAVTQITEKEAKTKHLGKVRGTVNFELEDSVVLEAFTRALAEISAQQPDPKPAPKAPKAPKAETAAPETQAQANQ